LLPMPLRPRGDEWKREIIWYWIPTGVRHDGGFAL